MYIYIYIDHQHNKQAVSHCYQRFSSTFFQFSGIVFFSMFWSHQDFVPTIATVPFNASYCYDWSTPTLWRPFIVEHPWSDQCLLGQVIINNDMIGDKISYLYNIYIVYNNYSIIYIYKNDVSYDNYIMRFMIHQSRKNICRSRMK